MPLIIMISGYQGSGKDTIGRNLTTYYGFTRLAFADMLKDEVADQYKINRALMDTLEGKAEPYDETRTVRDILLEHGQLRRNQDQNYWCNAVMEKIKGLGRVVITDWRFPHEYDAITNAFGRENVHTWRVNRIGRRLEDMDYSEYALNNWNFDHVFENMDCIGKLYQKVDLAVEQTLNFKGNKE